MRAVVIRSAESVAVEEVPDHLEALAIPLPAPVQVWERADGTIPPVAQAYPTALLQRHTIRPDNPRLPTVVAFWPPSWRDQWAIDTITEHAERLGLV